MWKLLERLFGRYQFFDALKHTKNYFGSYLLVNALGVISLPVYSALLTSAEFGIVEVFASMIKALVVITTLNLHAAVGRYYFREEKDYKEFIGSTIVISLGLFAISFALFYSFQGFFFSWLNIPPETGFYIFPAVLAGVTFSIFNQLSVARKESKKVAFVTVMWSYGMFGFALLFIWLLDSNFLGKIVGNTLAMSITALYMVYLLWPHIRLRVSLRHIRYMGFIALPLLPHALSGFILHYLDQLIIISEEGQSEAGLYSFSYKIGLLLWGFNMAVYNATLPEFFKLKKQNRDKEIRQQEKSMMRFMVLAAGFLVLFAEDLGHLLASNDAFTVALHLVPIIVAGYLFMGFFNLFNRQIYHANKNIYISLVTITAGVVNIVLNYMFIPQYGYIAAAYTTLASYFVMYFSGWLINRIVLRDSSLKLKVQLGFLLIFGIVFLLMSGILQLELGIWLSLILKAFVFCLLGLYLYRTKIRPLLQDIFS